MSIFFEFPPRKIACDPAHKMYAAPGEHGAFRLSCYSIASYSNPGYAQKTSLFVQRSFRMHTRCACRTECFDKGKKVLSSREMLPQ